MVEQAQEKYMSRELRLHDGFLNASMSLAEHTPAAPQKVLESQATGRKSQPYMQSEPAPIPNGCLPVTDPLRDTLKYGKKRNLPKG